MRDGFVKFSGCAGVCLLLAVGPVAGEKVRFGPPQGAVLQTRPERSVRESIELRPASGLNQPSVAAIPMSGPAPVAVPTRVSREDDADHENWIFRDTRSAAGVRKALGVDSAGPNLPAAAERDSVVVIQEYFTRQKAQAADLPTTLNSRADQSGSGLIGNAGSAGLAPGTTGFADTANQKAGTIFGESSFRNTLNSENSTVRRYFRDLYANPNSPGSEVNPASSQTANAPIALPGTKPTTTATDSTRSPSFQDLANRAAFIDSMTPAATLSPGLGPVSPVIQPNTSKQDAPTVNNGTLYERRNGRIEIPSRRF
jgi:hypothetical protein